MGLHGIPFESDVKPEVKTANTGKKDTQKQTQNMRTLRCDLRVHRHAQHDLHKRWARSFRGRCEIEIVSGLTKSRAALELANDRFFP